MIVEEGARGSALLEQEPRMLDGFILVSLLTLKHKLRMAIGSARIVTELIYAG